MTRVFASVSGGLTLIVLLFALTSGLAFANPDHAASGDSGAGLNPDCVGCDPANAVVYDQGAGFIPGPEAPNDTASKNDVAIPGDHVGLANNPFNPLIVDSGNPDHPLMHATTNNPVCRLHDGNDGEHQHITNEFSPTPH